MANFQINYISGMYQLKLEISLLVAPINSFNCKLQVSFCNIHSRLICANLTKLYVPHMKIICLLTVLALAVPEIAISENGLTEFGISGTGYKI